MNVTFDESLVQFKSFLTKHGWPSTLAWITPRDVLLTGSKVAYLKLPATTDGESRARQQFQAGTGHEFGVLLAALFKMDDSTYCYVWKPASELDAEGALIGKGLKISIPANPLRPRLVRNKLKWWLLWLWYRRKRDSKEWLFR